MEILIRVKVEKSKYTEPIIEPISVRLDVKRTVAYHTAMCAQSHVYVPSSSQLLLYNVLGVVDNIRINLGQRDLATLLSVWSDNFNDGRFIGEITSSWHSVSLVDPGSPSAVSEDPAVRKLAAFFSHSEQVRKEASLSFQFDGLQLFLFSDMDEVLSSPVRDLNHGLCKLETGEAMLSLESYTDHSMELKMSLQSCHLRDIRPDNNNCIRKIFQSHGGDQQESNSHVSVSTPPIVDITFRQSHTGDRCVDVLVERTRLNLSVPFVLELGRFVLDALPGDKTCEGGVINHGYVGDTGVQGKAPMEHPRPPSSNDSTSGYFSSGASCVDDQAGLSISLQLRRPEVMLFAGGGSASVGEDGGGQALLLRTEFLLDYSRHPGHSNLVCSLSGLHIVSSNKKRPHLVLHPCDLEFSQTFKAEEGLKVLVSMSTIDIRLSASIVHTLLDIVEEINLHLQTEEPDPLTNICHMASEFEDLWSPKKILPQVFPQHTAEHPLFTRTGEGRLCESLTVCMTKLRLVLELESPVGGSHNTSNVPVIMLRAAAEAGLHNWSSSAHMQGEVQLQVSYYNSNVGSWEPLIEPQVEVENVYRPWEVLFKVFQAKAYPLSSRLDHELMEGERQMGHKLPRVVGEQTTAGAEDSETSADEQEPEAAAMTFIRRRENDTHRKTMHESVSMVGYPADSDSDNEEGVMEKLACAIGHLFTGDSSDGEASESEESSGAEPSGETEDASEIESMSVQGTVVGRDERAVFLKKHSDSVDSGLEAESVDRMATYVMIESRDRLELTLSPVALRVISDLVASFTRQSAPALHKAPNLALVNDLTPASTVTLLCKTEATPGQVVMTASYARSDSLPSSPASTTASGDLLDEHTPSESENDIESFEGNFSVYSNVEHGKGDILSPLMRFPTETVAKLYNRVTDQRLRIEVPGFEKLEVLCPRRTVSKVHLLHPTGTNTTGARYYVVVNLDSGDWGRHITVRSPLQIRNETSYAMGIYYKKPVLEALGIEHIGESTNPFEDTNRIAIVEPDETYNVPLHVAYHCKLHILPAYVDSYHVSEAGLWWQDLAADLNTPKDIFCVPKEEKDQTVFSARALCEEGVAMSRVSRSMPNYLIRLLPPLAVHNRLPYAVQLKIPSIKYDVRIEAGDKANIYFLNLMKMHKIVVEVPSYLGIPWQGSWTLSSDLEEKVVAMATEHDTEGGNKQLGLNIRVERSEVCDVLLHAPYWIINKTGLPLQIRASLSDVVYEAQSEEPLLFCYRKHRRRCVRLRAYHSSWSSAFSLDTVGCSGLVVCRDRERKRRYRILLTVSLSCSSPHMTRIVTLLPNFLVTNETRRHLRFMEDNERADLWIDLAPSQCVPFWPDTDSMRMFVKFRDSKVVSQHFPIANIHQTVLRMDRGCGLCVEVSGGGERPFYIMFRPYQPGDAPVRVDNLCEDLFLKIHQQQLGQVALLSPYQSMLYTWDDPSKERCLLWNVYNKKCKGFMADFNKDGYGQERVSFHMVRQQPVTPTATTTATVTAKLSASLKRLSTPPQDESSSSDDSESDELQRPQLMKKTRKDKVVVFWVSYLEGPQRVLLFTQDERVAFQARGKIDAEKANLEIFLSMRGIGLSLVNNSHHPSVREVAYVSANDSSAVWEVNVAHKWKMLTLELASWIEERWKLDCKKAQMKEYVHVDFEKMHMTKPFYGELRRRYSPAVWLQLRKSHHHTYLHFKLHRLQVDNQTQDAVFPTVVNCTAVPPHIVRKVGVKPCVELAVMKRHRPKHNQDVYKFVKLLMQEFSIRLDKGFILSLYEMLSPWLSEEKPAIRIRSDITTLHQPASAKNTSALAQSKVVVEWMHVSPLKLQLSFSPRGSSVGGQFCCLPGRSHTVDVLHLLLDNIAPSLTDVKDIKLKTAFYETRGRVVTLQSELSEVLSHYTSQLMQQLHVLVLQTDVLGNPYALVADFTEGLGDLFYEPPLGTLESPEEFGEGLAQAAQVMMGHTMGGSALTNTLITSSITHTVNFDDDFKKKRRLCLQLSSELPDALILSSRTFEMGVALGLSGIIMKPSIIDGNVFSKQWQGSQQEGVESFFRGVGKGLMGLLTKPSGGVADCVAMANDGIKRASEMGEDIIFRTRLPRYANPYLGIKPFSLYEATGMQLLNTLSKGHYADTDIYWAHATLSLECKSTLLVTLQHVFLVEKCRAWEIDWMVRVDDIMAVPTLQGGKLTFKVRQDESFNLLSGDERFVQSKETAVLQWLQNKVETVLILNMEDKPCPSVEL
ncbi:intermembrane lipid transfer protein VPS13A-like [Macrosteles quadrilineatus]|uniref:intermembrane lipid transfer protein VPS13A-like n=1 Tax=Macrosteles quadrilineatus TaxID=74068 RepID=UPI0023E29A46|nr:intermembrane lipid transfer protein VPS13A-like [Macrosteles quadrilineatus]